MREHGRFLLRFLTAFVVPDDDFCARQVMELTKPVMEPGACNRDKVCRYEALQTKRRIRR